MLNDRGKPLSKLDIVKNFLIYETGKTSHDDTAKEQLAQRINYQWKEILENLAIANMTDAEDENNFLQMNYILDAYSSLSVRKDERGKRISINSQLADIHKLVKKKFKDLDREDRTGKRTYAALEKYITDLHRMSVRLKDLQNPYHENSFQSFNDKNRESLKTIMSKFSRLSKRSSILPLILAVYERFSDEIKTEELINLLNLCEIALFRIYYIADSPSYSARTKFASLATKIYNKKITFSGIKKEINYILDEYCPANKIKEKLLEEDDFYEWGGLKYFLYEFELKRCKEETPDKKPNFEWDDLKNIKKQDSIEHILPQIIIEKNGTEKKYWITRFTEQNHKKHLKRLGNLTLSRSNEKGGNEGYDYKKPLFQTSVWQITRDIAKNYSDWDVNAIDKREEELVNFAIDRWSKKITV